MHVILLWQPYQKINARIIDQKGVVVEVLGSYDYIQDLHKDLETRGYQVKNMVEKKVKFMSAGQIMTFCNTCQKLKSDVDVTDMANRNYIIDGKSLMGLMSIKLGLPMRVVVNGQDEEEANECFSNYEFE